MDGTRVMSRMEQGYLGYVRALKWLEGREINLY